MENVKNQSTKLVIERVSKELHFLGELKSVYYVKITAEINGLIYYGTSITEQGAAKMILNQLGGTDDNSNSI